MSALYFRSVAALIPLKNLFGMNHIVEITSRHRNEVAPPPAEISPEKASAFKQKPSTKRRALVSLRLSRRKIVGLPFFRFWPASAHSFRMIELILRLFGFAIPQDSSSNATLWTTVLVQQPVLAGDFVGAAMARLPDHLPSQTKSSNTIRISVFGGIGGAGYRNLVWVATFCRPFGNCPPGTHFAVMNAAIVCDQFQLILPSPAIASARTQIFGWFYIGQ